MTRQSYSQIYPRGLTTYVHKIASFKNNRRCFNTSAKGKQPRSHGQGRDALTVVRSVTAYYTARKKNQRSTRLMLTGASQTRKRKVQNQAKLICGGKRIRRGIGGKGALGDISE